MGVENFRLTPPSDDDDETLHLSSKGEYRTHPLFMRRGARNASSSTGNTNADVLFDFVEGKPNRGRAAKVPGGRRVHSAPSTAEPGALDLFSYNTIVARRHEGGDISTTPAKYSTTTSKLMTHLYRAMGQDYKPSGETRTVKDVFTPGYFNSNRRYIDIPFIHHKKGK